MTTSKGPWSYDAESGLVLTKDRTGDWTATFPYLSTEVCSVNPLDNDIDNGPLLAAAPEMLELLKDAYPYIRDDALRMRIGALIAKVDGI